MTTIYRNNTYHIPGKDILRLETHCNPLGSSWTDQLGAQIRRTYLFERGARICLLPFGTAEENQLFKCCKDLLSTEAHLFTDGSCFFLLTEDEPETMLPRIQIPASVSPHCFPWSTDPNRYPDTVSWLIASGKDERKLDEIAARMDIATAVLPTWNYVGLGTKERNIRLFPLLGDDCHDE